MSRLVDEDSWVWVVVQDPGGNEQFLGQQYEDEHVAFIPAFLEKEEAEKGLDKLARDRALKYEVQAVSFKDLVEDSVQNGFLVFILDGDGKVLEKGAS